MNKKKFLAIEMVIIALVLVFVAGAIFAVFVSKKDDSVQNALRCSGPTQYDLGDSVIKVNQALLISPDLGSGYFSLEGYLTTRNGVSQKLHRVINMADGRKTYRNIYEFRITDIHKSINDELNDDQFDALLVEFTGDKTRLVLDVVHVFDSMYLIGTPESYMFTCNAY